MKAGRCCGARLWRIELADDYSARAASTGTIHTTRSRCAASSLPAVLPSNAVYQYRRSKNVSVYNVLTSVLGVSPAPNDGDPSVVRSLLRD